MAIEAIHTLTDPRLDPFRSLKATNSTRHAATFVVEGDKLVERLLDSGFAVNSLLLSDRYLERFATCYGDKLRLLVVPDEWIEQIVGFNFHRGVLACARRKANPDLISICQNCQGRLTLVVCPDVQDPENMGAILRIASALGIDAVVLGSHCCDPLSRRVLRVSMGAALRVPIVEADNLAADLAAIRERCDVQLVAAVTHEDAQPLDDFTRGERLALLLGSEGHGLERAWIEMCDAKVTIPMQQGVDSLNVAVAAGILLYHLAR